MIEFIFPYLVTALGIFTIAIAFPKIRAKTIGRLQEQGFVPILKLKKSESEIIDGAGPDISLFFIGIIVTIFGIILIFNQ